MSPKRKNIPAKATEVKQRPKPSFGYAFLDESVVKTKDVSWDFLQLLIKQSKLMTTMTWDDVLKYKGLDYEEIPDSSMKYKIPQSLNRRTLCHIRLSQVSRVWGFREGDVFQIVWFDPAHQVTPERHKN